jgi:hypothetical protein
MTDSSPELYTLTIHFRGICTHFHHNVLPGVPHRVVLVDATSFRTGLVATEGPAATPVLSEYYLQPHIPTLHSLDASFSFDAPGLVEKGHIRSGVHLTVPNAVGYGVAYAGFQKVTYEEAVPSVTSFTDHYTYSSDVVLAGRAAAYLDIHSGTISAVKDEAQVTHVQAVIRTYGRPVLRMTPLAEHLGAGAPAFTDLVLPTGTGTKAEMALANSCWTPFEGSAEETNDYLLHLLTERAGIPRNVSRPKFELVPQSQESALEGLRKLFELGYPKSFIIATEGPPGTNESCSDARYP